VGKADGARETLVLLRIVVLETDLEFNRLDEPALVLLRAIQDVIDTRPKGVAPFELDLSRLQFAVRCTEITILGFGLFTRRY